MEASKSEKKKRKNFNSWGKLKTKMPRKQDKSERYGVNQRI
jgi:hypothetical protein